MYTISIEEYIKQLSSDAPSPGGGATAAVTAAQAAGLLAMVCNISAVKEGRTALPVLTCGQELASTAHKLLAMATADGVVFNKVLEAFKKKAHTIEEQDARSHGIQSALKEAADVPYQLLKICETLCIKTEEAYSVSKRSLMSDVAIAAVLLKAAMQACLYNIEINLNLITDPDFTQTMKAETDRILHNSYETLAQSLASAESKFLNSQRTTR